ncbi:site-specific DNA-methyltransferase [Polynucleobacter sp. 78F-HAINBA]|uniref:site-specific DNA-methyltransferase n=1 Tax=Polynucleobacter sp. 78F-HAINBA TaxID=2689099 RepID=UPI001C0C679A|nr:site-specific DNA-methyltransferase [Polynucleobacter sp. 78F-HAINBA]MBU3592027.1 site-specific DNA-methyltransferase [Polynucleobacter sp. 78F-HAINBA]
MGLSSQLKQLVDKDGLGENEADVAESLDVVQERTNQLKAIFPDVFSDGKVNFERLKAALGDGMARTNECYELSWAGKGDARREVQKRTTATLRPDTANSVNWDATQNLYIEGENLEVLRILQKAYFGKVKMIYIDPPYNTGNDSFVYPDDYSETLKEYQARTGETDESGFLNKQNLWKKNSKESGQFHSVWLSMMYPRLFLSRNLLSEDGVIFVSIDDNEAANLKLLMDEIFGEENFVGQFIWRRRASSAMADNNISSDHEYVICYQRGLLDTFAGIAKDFKGYKNPDNDPRGDWVLGDLTVGMGAGARPNQAYDLVDPKTNKVYPFNPNRVWAYIPESMNKLIEAGKIIFPQDPSARPMMKRFRSELKSDVNPLSTLLIDKVGLNTEATKTIQDIFGANYFEYSKPLSLVREFIRQTVKADGLILDFFSGSGTTAQAVLDLNEEDGNNRQFICVQMPELLEENSEAYKAGFRTIADIGRTRIKKVIEKIEGKRLADSRQASLPGAEDRPKQALGFNALKLTPSNFKEWRTDINSEEDLLAQLEYHIDSTKPDSEVKCMVYELLLKMALPITTPVRCYEIKSGATSNHIYLATPENAKSIAIFFDYISEEITEYILREAPAKVICLSKSFADSQALTNFDFQMQSANIALEIL